MNTTIPKWILAAFVGAAPMLGVVFLILFSCTLLGLVQRCKISIAKSYENRRRRYTAQERTSLTEGENPASTDLKAAAKNLIISPFDEIPMRDIDDDTLSRENSETKDISSNAFSKRSRTYSFPESNYDNGSSSIFSDNDFEHDQISLIEIPIYRKTSKTITTPDTIIHV